MLRNLIKSIYFNLPYFVRENSYVEAIKILFKKSLKKRIKKKHNQIFIDVKNITLNDAALDNFVGYALNNIGENSGSFLDYITSVKCSFNYLDHPTDPNSVEYYNFQKKMYRKISGKDYQIKFESSDIMVSEVIREPYKYLEFNQKRVSQELEAISLLIGELNLNYGDKFLECGGGRGHITEQLCLLGLDVTAIEIDKNFCKVVNSRLTPYKKKFKMLNTDFKSGVNSIKDNSLKGVLFHNCFHHSYDHRELLTDIFKKLTRDGVIFFLNEPISNTYKLPWGLRLDGESLFQIRRYGWYELGFREDYFNDMLDDLGFDTFKILKGESVMIKAVKR